MHIRNCLQCLSESRSGFFSAPQGDFIEETEADYQPDAIIDRTEFDISSLYQIQPLQFSSSEMRLGARKAVTSPFDRIYTNSASGENSFDISALFVQDGNYHVNTWNGGIVLTSSQRNIQYVIYKIGSHASNMFYNAENNDDAKVLNAEKQEIIGKYQQLYRIACEDNLEHTGESFYDDAVFGGYYTYTPFVEFVKENHLEYDIPSYSENQIRQAISCAFKIPDNFFYSISTGYDYQTFGSAGAFCVKDNPMDVGYQYFLMWNESGVYAVQCYYQKSDSLNLADYVRAVSTAHSDNDIYDRENASTDIVKGIRNISVKEITNPEDVFTDENYTSETNSAVVYQQETPQEENPDKQSENPPSEDAEQNQDVSEESETEISDTSESAASE